MSDMGDDFKALREMSQEKRANNRDYSASMLTQAGIAFDSRNDGAHLVVKAAEVLIDFWPGTGLWIQRGTNGRQRGVQALIRFVGAVSPKEPKP